MCKQKTQPIKMDDGFEEHLIYNSASDDSDADEAIASKVNEPIPSFIEDQLSSNDGLADALPNRQNLLEESDEDDLNKSVRRAKKNARILSSDDEKENSENEMHTNGMDVTNGINKTEHQTANAVRPSICDSDTKSSSDDKTSDREEVPVPKMVKKLKKKKKKKKHEQRKKHNNNKSHSDTNDDSDEENIRKHKKSDNQKMNTSDESSSSERSGSDSSAQSNGQSSDTKTVQPREKPVQRVNFAEDFFLYISFFFDFEFHISTKFLDVR